MSVKLRWPLLFQVINEATSLVIWQDTLILSGITITPPGTGGSGGSGGGPVIAAAPINADYIVGTANADLSNELVLGSQVIMRGLLAARSAATLAGRLYIATDSPQGIARDNASTWDDFYLSTKFIVPRVLTPAQITSNQNNYNPGAADIYRISTDASRNMTGLMAGSDGDLRRIINVGTQNLVLMHNDSGSGVANRFVCPASANLTLLPGDMAVLLEDSLTLCWRVFYLQGGTKAAATPWNNNYWGPPLSMYFG